MTPIVVDGIEVPPAQAAEAVQRCTRAIMFIDRKRMHDLEAEVDAALNLVKRILTGAWDGEERAPVVDAVEVSEADIVLSTTESVKVDVNAARARLRGDSPAA